MATWLALLAPLAPPPLTCRCQAAVVMVARTGQVLGGVHAYRQMDPASITKMMTAYLVIRAGHLNRPVRISVRAADTPGSRMRLHAGQVYTRLDLLRGLLLRSGNDAAVALAQSEPGGLASFVARMNRTARALGAYNTHFVNPNGLTAPGHYSSAYDLALIARAALALPLFQHLVSTRQDWIEELTGHQTRTLTNTNQLLEAFPGADGIKTGTTEAAGRCLAASATRGGLQLIVVILRSRDRWQDAAAALTWGFSYFHPVEVARTHQVLGRIDVVNGRRRHVPLWTAQPLIVLRPAASRLSVLVTSPNRVPAPIGAGTRLGTVYVLAGRQVLASAPLYTATAVPRRFRPPSWPWTRLVSHDSRAHPFAAADSR